MKIAKNHTGNSQNYNRYSYALNNPLKYTDLYGNEVSMETAVGASLAGFGGSFGNKYSSSTAGFNLYSVSAFGNTTIVSSFGDIGNVKYSANGGLTFENQTAGAYAGEVSVSSAGGGDIDWPGVSNASLNLLGGVGEMIVGGVGEYFSAGTATPASLPIITDGGVRVASNSARLVAYFTGHNDAGNSIAGNTGAWIGKGIDMATGRSFYDYGLGQGFGGATNDFLSFVVTGGTADYMNSLVLNPTYGSVFWYSSTYVGYSNSMFYDLYPIKK